jgi:hypothetical protein
MSARQQLAADVPSATISGALHHAGNRGREKKNTDPVRNWLVTPTVPPCASTMALTIASRFTARL